MEQSRGHTLAMGWKMYAFESRLLLWVFHYSFMTSSIGSPQECVTNSLHIQIQLLIQLIQTTLAMSGQKDVNRTQQPGKINDPSLTVDRCLKTNLWLSKCYKGYCQYVHHVDLTIQQGSLRMM